MKLTVIIPVLNEKDTIKDVADEVISVKIPMEKEIIIVDDGSSDGSTEIIRAIEKESHGVIRAIYKKKSGGKGAAIIDAVNKITGDVVMIQDADHEYAISDYTELIKPFLSDKADVVIGSRFKGSISNMKFENRIANMLLTFTANMLYGIHITDEATAYKLFKSTVFRKFKLESKRFEFCPEVVAKSAVLKCKISEVPVSYSARTVKEGKKIKWFDLVAALWALLRFRFWKP
jgi:glycosyltransferase involved in cell wall biosynthesis